MTEIPNKTIQNYEKFSRTWIRKRFVHSILFYQPAHVNFNFMKIAEPHKESFTIFANVYIRNGGYKPIICREKS